MWVERLYEDFTTDLGDLYSTAGNGSVSVDSGNALIQTPGSVECNWWNTTYNCPIVYGIIDEHLASPNVLVRIEWNYLSQTLVSGTNYARTVFSIHASSTYAYWWWHRAETALWQINRNINGASSALTSETNLMIPPAFTRVYLNRTNHTVGVPGISISLAPWCIAWAYSLNGEDWFHFASYDISALNGQGDLKFGVALLSTYTAPAYDLRVDNVYLHEWEGELVKQIPYDGNKHQMGAVDEVVYDSREEGEYFIPGVGAPKEKEVTAPIHAGIKDEADFINLPTVPAQKSWFYPEIGGGYFMRGLDYDVGQRFPHSGVLDEGETDWRLGGPVQFRPDTSDSLSHNHFIGLNPICIFYYRATDESWANPTTTSFTGFARDGYHYTDGVLDSGPVSAPWAAESSGSNRSNRFDFPYESLLVVTEEELVIFDLDDFPTDLTVWMRFILNGSTSFNMIGGENKSINSCSMRNGILVVGLTQISAIGGVVIINFRNDGDEEVAQLIRSDNHYRWATGYDITHRNAAHYTTSGVSPSLQVGPEYMYSVDIYDDGDGKAWVACSGEDLSPNIIGIENEKPQWISICKGRHIGDYNVGDVRKVLFDENGWLWFSINNYLFRSVFDYQGGILIADQNNPRQRGISFQEPLITALAQGRNYIYVGTNRGVYRVHKGSLNTNLIYTVADGGGGGYDNSPPAGELLSGENSVINHLSVISIDKCSILQVGMKAKTGYLGGITTIRLLDDVIIGDREYPDIPEDSVFAGTSAIGA